MRDFNTIHQARTARLFPGTGRPAAMLTALGILLAISAVHHAQAQDGPAAEVSDAEVPGVEMIVAASELRSGGRLDRMFGRLDTDANGTISSAEISARRGEAFDRFDADGDGELTVTEIAAAQEAAREMMLQARTLRSVARARSYVAADADDNGTLSKAEFSDARGRMFERIDANDDGDITREEAENARSAWREARKSGRGWRGRWHHGGGHE